MEAHLPEEVATANLNIRAGRGSERVLYPIDPMQCAFCLLPTDACCCGVHETPWRDEIEDWVEEQDAEYEAQRLREGPPPLDETPTTITLPAWAVQWMVEVVQREHRQLNHMLQEGEYDCESRFIEMHRDRRNMDMVLSALTNQPYVP